MKQYYFCLYEGSLGPVTSFVVPLEEKDSYRAKISSKFKIIQDYEVTVP